jgi:hypothetical protein
LDPPDGTLLVQRGGRRVQRVEPGGHPSLITSKVLQADPLECAMRCILPRFPRGIVRDSEALEVICWERKINIE